ncbi:hypothetical protein BC936DRAFT_144999 [Jimgerdemannia flammicorona]|uniref:TRAF-type domain-containing protein n=1 Tax=Jimgerdemannia flammicorona TaxID=994334 RepID=A0A433DB65_9FUNG|nr:hypothetical protein BC936DRAFT_144999 [Jimgerdemannia flammicorona]
MPFPTYPPPPPLHRQWSWTFSCAINCCFPYPDRSSFTTEQASKFVRRQIGRLEVRCWFFELGCEWTGPFSDNHETNVNSQPKALLSSPPSQCPFQQIHCPNEVRGCADRPRRIDVPIHLETCPYELVSCPNNATACAAFLRKSIDTHERTCRSYQCDYAREGCVFVATRPEAIKHCDEYCGRLFAKIKELETKCEVLSRMVGEEQITEALEMNGMTGYVGRQPKRVKVVDQRVQEEQNGEDMIEKLLRESEADLPYDEHEDDVRSLSSLFPDRLDDNSEDEVMFIDNGQGVGHAQQAMVVEQSPPHKRSSRNNFLYPSSRSRVARAGPLSSADAPRGTVDGLEGDVVSISKTGALDAMASPPNTSLVVKPKPKWGAFFSPNSFQLSTTTTITTTSLGVAYSSQHQKRGPSAAPSSSPSPSTSLVRRRGSKNPPPTEVPDSMIPSLGQPPQLHVAAKPVPLQQETPGGDDDLFDDDDVIAIGSPSLARNTGPFDTPGDDGPLDSDARSDFEAPQGVVANTSNGPLPPINDPTLQSELSELGDDDQVIGVAMSPAVVTHQPIIRYHSQPQQQQQQQQQQQHRHYPRGQDRTHIAQHANAQYAQQGGHHNKGSVAAASSHAGGVPKRPMFVLASSYLGKWARNGSAGRSGSVDGGGTTPKDGDGEDSVDSPF